MFNSFPTNLKRMRGKVGLTQFGLAILCNLTPSHISRIERGEINVRLKTLGRMAKALGVAPEDLISSNIKKSFFKNKNGTQSQEESDEF